MTSDHIRTNDDDVANDKLLSSGSKCKCICFECAKLLFLLI